MVSTAIWQGYGQQRFAFSKGWCEVRGYEAGSARVGDEVVLGLYESSVHEGEHIDS